MTEFPAPPLPDDLELDDWHPDMAEPDPPADRSARARRDRMPAWRAALQAGVTAVSPALVDMAAARGVDLARAASRLRPPDRWRPGDPPPAFGDLDGVWPHAPEPRRRVSPWGRHGREPVAPRVGAVSPDHPEGFFVVALDGPALSGCARVGGAVLLTHGGLLQVWFEAALPETVMAAAAGIDVDRIVAHPVLSCRGYAVVRASRSRSWTVLDVDTGVVPFAMPWPRLAGEAVA